MASKNNVRREHVLSSDVRHSGSLEEALRAARQRRRCAWKMLLAVEYDPRACPNEGTFGTKGEPRPLRIHFIFAADVTRCLRCSALEASGVCTRLPVMDYGPEPAPPDGTTHSKLPLHDKWPLNWYNIERKFLPEFHKVL